MAPIQWDVFYLYISIDTLGSDNGCCIYVRYSALIRNLSNGTKTTLETNKTEKKSEQKTNENYSQIAI